MKYDITKEDIEIRGQERGICTRTALRELKLEALREEAVRAGRIGGNKGFIILSQVIEAVIALSQER